MVHFNYSKEDFYSLTLTEAVQILNIKKEYDNNKLEFWTNQFRLANYFNVKSGMADTKRIRKPEDLYSIPSDELRKQLANEKLKSLADRKLSAHEMKVINALCG